LGRLESLPYVLWSSLSRLLGQAGKPAPRPVEQPVQAAWEAGKPAPRPVEQPVQAAWAGWKACPTTL